MKWIGQHIYDLISRFRNDVYLEDISSGTIASGGNLGLDSNNKIVKASAGGISFDGSTANGVLTYKDSDEASVESTLTYDSEILTIGVDDNGYALIRRSTHSDGNGGELRLQGGIGTGTSKTGGDIHLYGGTSTGTAEGGALKFTTSTSDGSADASLNVPRQVFQVTSSGSVVWTGEEAGNSGSDNDLSIVTDGSMSFVIDRDNDETSQSFAWSNYATEIMNLDESGNLQIDGGLTTGGTITTDNTASLTIKPGDASGTNTAGASLTLSGGISTGNAEGGSIIFKSNNAGSSGTSANTQQTIAALDSDGNLQIDGALTTGGTLALSTTGLIQVANQSNITGVGTLASGNATAIVDAASDTAAGKVELATTAEADTGTDTARAVTPAGLKSHVDARYHYQYISFLSNMTTASNWGTMSNNGISNHSWNQSLGTTGTTVGSSTGTVPVSTIAAGIVVPYDSTLVGFKAIGMGGSNHQYELGLMIGVPTFNDYATFDVTLRAYKAAVAGSPDTNYQSRPIAIEDLTRSYSITAGHVIYPCVKSASGSGTNKVSWTIVLKTLIPS